MSMWAAICSYPLFRSSVYMTTPTADEQSRSMFLTRLAAVAGGHGSEYAKRRPPLPLRADWPPPPSAARPRSRRPRRESAIPLRDPAASSAAITRLLVAAVGRQLARRRRPPRAPQSDKKWRRSLARRGVKTAVDCYCSYS